ncbi:MAG: arsenate reductase ArsC [Rhodothalassiaceae bacterium]
MAKPAFHVLFLCTGNSARSILAEAILARAGHGRFRAFSAGSQPKPTPHPLALQILQDMGFDTQFARSKSWQEFAAPNAPKMDLVLTVCDSAAAEACPVWPGAPMTAHWGLPDPAAVDGPMVRRRQAFIDAFQVLRARIAFLVDLPVEDLDRRSLQEQLTAIGAVGLPPQKTLAQ